MKRSLKILTASLIFFNISAFIGFADIEMPWYDLVPAAPVVENMNFVKSNVEKDVINNIDIISPQGDIILKDSLLVSVKITGETNVDMSLIKLEKIDADENSTIKSIEEFSFSEKVTRAAYEIIDEPEVTEIQIFGPKIIEIEDEFQYFMTQIDDIIPGEYKLVLQVKNEDEQVKYIVEKQFVVKDKQSEVGVAEDQTPLMEVNKTNGSIQNLLMNILK